MTRSELTLVTIADAVLADAYQADMADLYRITHPVQDTGNS